MSQGFPTNRNKEKTLAKVMGRVTIDLLEDRDKEFESFKSNTFAGGFPVPPDAPYVGCACCEHTVTVSSGEDADFTSVQDAIDFAVAELPSITEPWVVLVCPGVYQENITIGNSYIHLIGIGPRGSAIIEMTDGNTYVGTVGNVFIENIHFKCIGTPIYVGPNIGAIKISNTTTDLTFFRDCIFETQLEELLGYNIYIYEATVTIEDSRLVYNQTGNEAAAAGIHSTVLFDSDADFRMVGCEIENIVEDENNPMAVFNDPNNSGIRLEVSNNKFWYESIAANYVLVNDISLAIFTGDNLPGFLALTRGSHKFFNNLYYGVASVGVGMFVHCYKMNTNAALLTLNSQFNELYMEVNILTPLVNMIYYNLTGGGLVSNKILISFDQTEARYGKLATAFDVTKYVISSSWGELDTYHGALINAGQGTAVTDDFTAQGGTVQRLLKTIAATDTVELGNITDWTAGNVIYIPLNDDIETAITNATAGDTLILADGTYTITNPITVGKAINIIGQGKRQTILSSATAGIDVFDLDVDDIMLSNFTIDVNATGNCIGILVDPVSLVDNILLSNLEIMLEGAGEKTGIETNIIDNWLIEDCDIYCESTDASEVWGIKIDFSAAPKTVYNRIVDCDIRANTTVGGNATGIHIDNGLVPDPVGTYDLVNVHSEANSVSGTCYGIFANRSVTVVNIYEGTYSITTSHANSREIYNMGTGSIMNCYGAIACQNNNGFGTTNEGRIIAGGVDLDHPPRTGIYLSTPMLNLVIGGWTNILFDAMEFDSDSQADLPNNRIIIKYTGYYLVIASCRWSGGINPAASRMSAQILCNGATIDVDDSHGSVNTYLRNPNHRIKLLTAGDFITAQARPFTAGNTADIQAGQNVTYLQLHRLS